MAKELSILLLAKNMASKTINQVSKDVGKLGKTSAIVSKGMNTLATNVLRIGIVGGTALVGLIALAVKEGQEVARIDKLFANAIKSSGQITAAQTTKLIAQQTALLKLTGADDELVSQLQTRLIQMRATGEQTLALTPLILAAATATGKAPETVSMAVGKALQGNAGALGRIGIVLPKLTAEQKKAITGNKKLTEAQKAAALQTVYYNAVLAEMTKRFGKVNEALSGTLEVRLKVLRESLASIREDMGIKLLPVITRIVDVVGSQLVPAFGKFVDRILPDIMSGMNTFADALEGGGAERAINGISDALGSVITMLKLAAAPAKAIVSAFMALPSQIQTLLIGGFAINKLSGGMLTQLAGGAIGGALQRGGSPLNPLYVKDVGLPLGGGKGGAPLVPAAGAGLLATMLPAIAGAAAIAGLYWLGTQNQNAPNPVPDSNLLAAQAWGAVPPTAPNSAIKQWNDRGGVTGPGGGRGDKSTADEVKRLGRTMATMDGVIARAVANGLTPTKTGIVATMDKNVRATQSGDDRVALRIDSLNTAIRAIKIAPVINVPVYVTSTVSVRNQTVAMAVRARYVRARGSSGDDRTIL